MILTASSTVKKKTTENEEMSIMVNCFSLANINAIKVAIIGITTNGMSAFIIFKMDHLRNAFGYSCASHAFGNLGVLLIFAFWAAPLLVL